MQVYFYQSTGIQDVEADCLSIAGMYYFLSSRLFKNGRRWDFTARVFGIKSSILERGTKSQEKVISDYPYEKYMYVQRAEEK